MQITVFGASGKVGQQVVSGALERGWTVTAFVHRSNPFTHHQNLTLIKGELTDVSAVANALTGSNAVISALGSWHTPDKNILTTGMHSIIPAMKEQGLERLITVTGAGALWSGDQPSAIDRLFHRLLGLIAPKILADGEEHLRLLAASSLNWTAIRSPVMTRGKKTRYRLTSAPAPLWALVPRAAVAQCIIDQVHDTAWSQQAPVIRRR